MIAFVLLVVGLYLTMLAGAILVAIATHHRY